MSEELTLEFLEFVEREAQEASNDKQYSLLLADDIAASLKDNAIQKLLKKLIYNRRHLKLTIWMSVQNYNSIPLSLRKTITHAIVFKPRNKKEFQAIFDEIIQIPKNNQQQLLDHVYNEPYSFMLLDTNQNKIYKKFNLLELNF